MGAVALRKESVDRNIRTARPWAMALPSLSARRAWIEILTAYRLLLGNLVALRKESVDRNSAMHIVIIVVDTSLSARRAWIEIFRLC